MESCSHFLIEYFSKNILINSRYNILSEDNNVSHIKSPLLS